MENVLIYLVGFAGTGKLTIARALAEATSAKVVDNQWINNPIFGLLDHDRLTPYPEGVWRQIDKVREAVLETVATLGAAHASYVFTHEGFEDDAGDRQIYEAIREIAQRRKARFLPVRLLCNEDEIAKRVVSPERALRLKSMDPEQSCNAVRNSTVLKPNHENELTLDISEKQPADVVELILEQVAHCKT
ncbi:AAA family ATPase [Pseudovibrio brasiliensis]|uniref:Shikimate kinase n=1 Tax=Pseudovibrio brasiliensis TaxID=1898042 RepID=A0ABX8ALM4_9HYPH|nr:hypothetical protein [Pseudovibrio brasiliensis]QUS55572.1 hypothetical protein KGB56_20060 [Pseudovibrio brasiliensis]